MRFIPAILLFVHLAANFAGLSFANADEKQPNIILFVTDDHGLDALGCYGNPIIQTPNMDRLAADGVRFTRAYCTSASCAASRSVILTGQYFGNRKVKDYLFRADFELYDLSNDPNELHNLAGNDSHAKELEPLKQKLKAFQIKTKDPWQIKWNNESQVQGTGVGL